MYNKFHLYQGNVKGPYIFVINEFTACLIQFAGLMY